MLQDTTKTAIVANQEEGSVWITLVKGEYMVQYWPQGVKYVLLPLGSMQYDIGCHGESWFNS